MAISTGNAGKGKVTADINVTPMIDVMLVLLIIFMLITPLVSTGFQAVMPAAKNNEAAPEDKDDILLGIDNEGNYFLQSKPIAKDQVEAQLTQMFQNREKDKILYFKADQHLKFGRIQEAVEIARRAGVRVMAAVTERKSLGGN
ncbi:MAG TPA: biopolymer transporter ExbD [Gemmatimonadales bacterium]|nr:biopolymer transporter ExbD [Gemmatimonadales bacterium]